MRTQEDNMGFWLVYLPSQRFEQHLLTPNGSVTL